MIQWATLSFIPAVGIPLEGLKNKNVQKRRREIEMYLFPKKLKIRILI